MEKGREVIVIHEDDPAAEAPLYNLRVKVRQPPSRQAEFFVGHCIAGVDRSVHAVSQHDEIVLVGLATRPELNGVRGKLVHLDPDSGRWNVLCRVDGKNVRFNVREENIMKFGHGGVDEGDRPAQVPSFVQEPPAVPCPALVDAHNLAHVYEPWCELCVAGKAHSNHHRGAEKTE